MAVGLSDCANGPATSAPDNYYRPVVSIDTIIGTARLDYVIADPHEAIKQST